MPERSSDWMRQAERDLASARIQSVNGFHEWACFIAQQAAEKAVKSVYQRMGGEAWGHSVSELLKGLKDRLDIGEELIDKARELDRFYIPSRYPNGWHSGIPGEYFNEKDSQHAIGNTEEILRFCQDILAR